MIPRIKALQIEGFRGIPKCDIPINGKSVVLKGENGSGKSSIVDALELFFTGKISHLEGIQGLSLPKHATHVNFKPDDVCIKVTFDPGDICLSCSLSSTPRFPPPLSLFLNNAQRGVFILRRFQILNFIASQPADRFRAIGSILGIEKLDNIELELMRLRDDYLGQTKTKQSEIATLFQDLGAALQTQLSSQEEILPALNIFLKKNNLEIVQNLKEAESTSEILLKAIKQQGETIELKALNELCDMSKISKYFTELSDGIVTLDSILASLHSKNALAHIPTLDVLRAGQIVIESTLDDYCPLCEQPIDRTIVLDRITHRINDLMALSEEAALARQLASSLATLLQPLVIELEHLEQNIAFIPGLIHHKSNIDKANTIAKTLKAHLSSANDLNNRFLTGIFNYTITNIGETLTQISTAAKFLFGKVILNEEDKKILEIDRVIQKVVLHFTSISEAIFKCNISKRQHDIANEFFNAFSISKKHQIQTIYDSLQADIEYFYDFLHPNEFHRNIELSVVQDRRASAVLKLESFGKTGQDPRAYCSEGHLNSLGLCIFLAFIKRFNEDLPLVILDDIVTTIDAAHRLRICSLLFENFEDKQFIITTHDSIWFRQLKDAQNQYLISNKYLNYELINWDLDNGPILKPYRGKWASIEEKLHNVDRIGAGNAGRQYLELILFEICFTTRAAIPIPLNRESQFEIKDLWDAVISRMKALLPEGDYLSRFLGSLRSLQSTIIMGNILSHNNSFAENISITEVQAFCEAVHAFRLVFSCSKCSNLFKYDREAKRLMCKSPKCTNPDMIRTN
jgi:DNA repair exonuclease SbcCD ATPase subunit